MLDVLPSYLGNEKPTFFSLQNNFISLKYYVTLLNLSFQTPIASAALVKPHMGVVKKCGTTCYYWL